MASTNNWCSNSDGKSWNVKNAEGEIEHVRRLIVYARRGKAPSGTGAPDLIDILYRDPEMNQAVRDAALELDAVIEGRKHPSGGHLTHGVSGKTVYNLYDNSFVSYTHVSVHTDEEEAKKAAAEFPESALARVEQMGDSYVVMVVDEEETDFLRSSERYGDFIGTFSTREEAEEELRDLEYGYIVESPSDEWWMVVDDKTNHSLFDMVFPSKNRAIAFLYKLRMPPAWRHYIEMRTDAIEKAHKKKKEEEQACAAK